MADKMRAITDYPAISFIGNYTIDKLEEEMIAWYQEKYAEVTGKETTLGKADERRLMLQTCAYFLFLGYKDVDLAGKMATLKYAVGDYLENLGALKGVYRLSANAATTTIRYAVMEARESATPISKGSRVTAGDNVYFATQEYAEIPAGSLYVDVKADCLTAGADGNVYGIGEINTMVDIIAYIDSASNITKPENGRDIETDDDLRERIYTAQKGFSTGGTSGAYEYMVRQYDTSIEDIRITSPDLRVVQIVVLLANGEIPGEEYLSDLKVYIEDPQRKMLTDEIVVKKPTEEEYDIELTYYINSSDKSRADTIQSEVNTAIDEYKLWQRLKLGRDINPDELTKRIMQAGAKRVSMTAPAYKAISSESVAVPKNVSITYGGIEDD